MSKDIQKVMRITRKIALSCERRGDREQVLFLIRMRAIIRDCLTKPD